MKILVTGAGGFIGSHLVKHLVNNGHFVVGIDLKEPSFSKSLANVFYLQDLRNFTLFKNIVQNEHIEEIYQLAADMGGADFIFTGDNDLDIVLNSIQININTVKIAKEFDFVKKIFFSSSACCYPKENQLVPDSPICSESSVYPANPDSEYGWEKLFSERLFQTLSRLSNTQIRIARFHNIFGPDSVFSGGREKAPAAICRKVALANNGDSIQIYGDGNQTRSFLFIDEAILGISKLMNSNCSDVLNIGSEEMVTITQLALMIIKISKKNLTLTYINGPQGVRGRNSDNTLILQKLNWKPNEDLFSGLTILYSWIHSQIKKVHLKS